MRGRGEGNIFIKSDGGGDLRKIKYPLSQRIIPVTYGKQNGEPREARSQGGEKPGRLVFHRRMEEPEREINGGKICESSGEVKRKKVGIKRQILAKDGDDPGS